MFATYGAPIGMKGSVIPSFLPTKINFYNRFTGQTEVQVDPQDNVYITSVYRENCEGGATVTISGLKKDVDKVMTKLNNINFDEEKEVTQDDMQLFPIGSLSKQQMIEKINAKKNQLGIKTNTNSILSNGWEYIINPKNRFNVLLRHPTLGNNAYSGSGIIIIENAPVPRIILAKTVKRNKYEDFGGNLYPEIVASNETLADNAIKELAEESQSLFLIENLDLESKINGTNRYVNIKDQINTTASITAFYRCYFVCVRGLENSNIDNLFNENRSVTVNSMNLGVDYEETIELARFNLSDIAKCIRTTPAGEFMCNNTNGIQCMIRDRTADCLRTLFSSSNANLYTNIVNNCVDLKRRRIMNPEFGQMGRTNFVM